MTKDEATILLLAAEALRTDALDYPKESGADPRLLLADALDRIAGAEKPFDPPTQQIPWSDQHPAHYFEEWGKP